ncbi:DUF2809 domain-containing protein [uncultured Psychroserpens sp.]|uniref:ribosomal maturation YjgA family protein n=1 Tax=uncultured Psychroserpens sp. TaxID=255436 RepID=UPI0026198CD0|nr:DUF2809 domain-containing protein [uncultured Psychroserpens sp.]
MTIKFNLSFFATSLILLLVEIYIAVYLSEGFIRHTFGDFLVVILIYCLLRSFIRTKPIYIAILVLGIAFLIEFLQLFNLLDLLNLRNNKWAIIILGSTFRITDLVAYTLGVIITTIIDLKTTV